ncbi:MAG TPA: methionine synthase [Bacteroidales bacterium]|nr:methionine synthase [Bacteroidales bacterium]
MNWQNNPPGSLLSGRILILDGAMGTMIQRFAPSFPPGNDGNNDILTLTQPELILSIHREYVQAGADIITTNTFNANAISQQDYGMQDQVYTMNFQAARLARESDARFVAGSLGPTNKSASISPDMNRPGVRATDFATLVGAYREQARGLKEGGVDLFLVETVFDALNAKAALFALSEEAPGMPVMLSATIADNSGRILSGQTLEAFLVSTAHAGLFSVGLNCSFGPDKMLPYVRILSRFAPGFTSAHPNAGLPDMFGKYTLSPEAMAQQVKPYVEEGLVNIIGGCCGTTPDHIEALAGMVRKNQAPLRRVPVRVEEGQPQRITLSGLEMLTVREEPAFLIAGERTNVSGSRKFARLIREKQYDQALEIARGMVRDGAHILDVNTDDPMLDAPTAMREFLFMLGSDPEVARVPLMLDSSRWEVLLAGLQCVQGKSIVNSISLKEGPEAFLRKAKLIKQYGAVPLVMAFDEQGQASTRERRIEICTRAFRFLVDQAGFEPHDIILDPNVLAVGTGMEEHRHFAVDFIDTVRYLKQNLQGALVIAGVSNLSFAFRGNETIREAMHAVFLYHAIAAGLDMAIVKPGAQPIYSEIPEPLRRAVEDVILDTDAGATSRLIEMAATINGPGQQEAGTVTREAWRDLDAEERLHHALAHGIEEYLEEDLEALCTTPAIDIVEHTLMEGMKRVGKLFGEGKMFLPQVVRTARTMKRAVSILQPRIEAEKNSKTSGNAATETVKGIIATVRGDVHDIGKNLVILVMECNNYKVSDLGVMVPAHKIVEAAIREQAAFVGLSALITPSLDEMVDVAGAMEKAGLTTPLLIGGATTSSLFTSLRIAPLYSGPVIHCPDAAGVVPVLAACTSKDPVERERYFTDLRASQKRMRDAYGMAAARKEYLSPAEARANKWVPSLSLAGQESCPCCGQHRVPDDFVPPFMGVQHVEIPFAKLRKHLDWDTFLHIWEVRESREQGKTAVEDAVRLLDDLIGGHYGDIAKVRAAAGFWPAVSTPDDHILFFAGDSSLHIVLDLPMERDLLRHADGSPNTSLADFIAAADPAHTPDHAGLFLLTASSPQLEKLAESMQKRGDVYNALILRTLLDLLAEAASEALHRELMVFSCGAPRGIRPAFGYPSCPDHTLKQSVVTMLQPADELGIALTSSCMLQPAASVCGMYISHPQAHYITVHKDPGL